MRSYVWNDVSHYWGIYWSKRSPWYCKKETSESKNEKRRINTLACAKRRALSLMISCLFCDVCLARLFHAIRSYCGRWGHALHIKWCARTLRPKMNAWKSNRHPQSVTSNVATLPCDSVWIFSGKSGHTCERRSEKTDPLYLCKKKRMEPKMSKEKERNSAVQNSKK